VTGSGQLKVKSFKVLIGYLFPEVASSARR
jgi:hypothetical protein